MIQVGGKHIEIVDKLDLDKVPPGSQRRFGVHLVSDGLGMPIYVPAMVARGKEDGPTVAITAAVHGNELNGIPVVQRVFRELDKEQLSGTVIGIPVVNVPGLQLMQRKFNDDEDLNRIMPGKALGNNSEVYAHRLLYRVLHDADYLLDLHTASFGRVNSYYIRANLSEVENARLAHLQNPQIILDSSAPDSTLRGFFHSKNARAVTLEVGDPNRFQKGLIRSGLTGIFNTLIDLGMIEGEVEPPEKEPVICSHSYWQYTDEGGFLEVLPQVTDLVSEGEVVALLRNIFGDILKEYKAQADGIIIGKSSHPVAQTGSRIIHLGIKA
ncbi:MAG: succinylglutamate desuccinylase/aspartoacylase family protein [Saprospiraceae bacterium]|nr:succinylglutamate desuccinylase/aspartoacylase family protein [Saprospiraceae bacterium]